MNFLITTLLFLTSTFSNASIIEQRLNILSHNNEFKKVACEVIHEAGMDLDYSDDFELIYNIENHYRYASDRDFVISNGLDAKYMHYHAPSTFPISRATIKDIITRIYQEHSLNDEYEKNQSPHPVRNLKSLQQNGIYVQFIDDQIDVLKKIITNERGSCSFTDQIKNEKLLMINEFHASKCALIFHDCFDHFWTYNLLEENGILERYKDFLQSVGNPHLTDMFNREGELIASISYAFRFIILGNNNNHLISFDEVKNLFAAESQLTSNARKAYSIINDKENDKDYQRKLASIVSDLLIELMEQRRRFGFIRKLDENFEIAGNLPTLDLEYLSLIIEAFDCLYGRKERTIQVATNILLIFENYISDVITNDKNYELNATLHDIENGYNNYPFLSEEKISWIKSHIHTLSTRKVQC